MGGALKKEAGESNDPGILAMASRALALIKDGHKIGLGSGRAATVFIKVLGKRIQEGLRVQGVPTSEASARLARKLCIPLIELAENTELDLTVDGADEAAPNLDLVKGWGGALVRERIVAAASRRQIILVGPEKLVSRLGARGRIPVEVIPLAEGYVTRKLKALNIVPTPRLQKKRRAPYLTDNGNMILDCALAEPLKDGLAARELETAILVLPGVVDTGLFLGTAEQVLVGYPDGRVDVLSR